jgi:hypothetical protein
MLKIERCKYCGDTDVEVAGSQVGIAVLCNNCQAEYELTSKGQVYNVPRKPMWYTLPVEIKADARTLAKGLSMIESYQF